MKGLGVPLRRIYLRLGAHFILGWIAKNITASPNRFDIVFALRSGCELFAKLTDKDVNDLQFRLVHATVKMVEEHFFCEGCALTKGKKFQHLVLFSSQVNTVVTDFNSFSVKIDLDVACCDDGLAVPLRTADNCMNTCLLYTSDAADD